MPRSAKVGARASEYAMMPPTASPFPTASELEILSDTELRFVTGAVASAAGLDLVVERADAKATLADAVERHADLGLLLAGTQVAGRL